MVKRVVTTVEVVDAEKRRLPSKHYVYVIKVTWSDGSTTVVYRRYSRFFEFQVRLLEAFPEEAGSEDPTQRMIPFLPGKIFFGRSHIREVAMKRLKPIDQYCKTLIRLPSAISESHLVLQFFQVEEEDLNPIRDEKDRQRGKTDPVGDVISEPMLLEQYVAIADYKKQKKNEVSLVAGASVEVVEKTENGWWFVRVEEDQGWVPASYLEPADGGISTSQELKRARPGEEEQFVTTDSYTAANVDELSFEKGVVIDVIEKNMEGWWLVRYNGREGVVPAAYLQYMTARPSELGSGHTGGVEVVATVSEAVTGQLEQQATDTEKKKNDKRKEQIHLKPLEAQGGRSALAPRRQSIKVTKKMRSQLTSGVSKQLSVPEGGVLAAGAALAVTKSKSTPPAADTSADSSDRVPVMVTYRAVGSTEISLDEGAEVAVLERNNTGWWYVEAGGRRGWAPSSSFLNNAQSPPSSPETGRSRGSSDEQADTRQYVTMADFTAAADDGISFKGGQEVKVLEKAANGWWFCIIDGQEGWVPSSYIEEKPSSTPVSPKSSSKPDLAGDLAKVSLRSTRKDDVKQELKPSPSAPSSSDAVGFGKIALKPVRAGGDESKESGAKGVPGGGRVALKPSAKNSGDRSGSASVKPALKPVASGNTEQPAQTVKKSTPLASDQVKTVPGDDESKQGAPIVLPAGEKAALKPVAKKPSDQSDSAAVRPALRPVTKRNASESTQPVNKTNSEVDETSSVAEKSGSVAAQIAKLRAVPSVPTSGTASGSDNGPTAAVRKPLKPPAASQKLEAGKQLGAGNSTDSGLPGKRFPAIPSKADGSTAAARSPAAGRRGTALKPNGVPQVNSRPTVQKPVSNPPAPASREQAPTSGNKAGKVKAPPGLAAMFGGGDKALSTSPSKEPAMSGEEYVVIADYEKEDDSGINLRKGQKVTVDEKNPNGWWFVICGSGEGWAPSTFLEKADKGSQVPSRPLKPPQNAAKKPAATQRPSPAKTPGATGESTYVVSADYTAEGRDDISLKEGTTVTVLEKADTGWWFVKDGGREGWAPSTFLTEKSSKPLPSGAKKPTSAAASSAKKPPKLPGRPTANTNMKKYVAVADFSGEGGEVSLTQGQVVDVLEKADTGWWYIKAGSKEGWAPSTYIEMA